MINVHQLLHKIACLEKQIKDCCESSSVDITQIQQDIQDLQNQIPSFLADDQTAMEVFTTQAIGIYPIGTAVQTVLLGSVHNPVTLTNNEAPFSFNTTTQAGNIPKVGSLTNNLDGTYTYKDGAGGTPVTFKTNGTPVSDSFIVGSGDTITLTSPVYSSMSVLVFRNGSFTKDYVRTGNNIIFAQPFGNSTGGTGNETINVEYYTV